jgi:hypothetical protein
VQKNTIRLLAAAAHLQIVFPCAARQERAQADKASYPAMASLDQYPIPNQKSELAC